MILPKFKFAHRRYYLHDFRKKGVNKLEKHTLKNCCGNLWAMLEWNYLEFHVLIHPEFLCLKDCQEGFEYEVKFSWASIMTKILFWVYSVLKYWMIHNIFFPHPVSSFFRVQFYFWTVSEWFIAWGIIGIVFFFSHLIRMHPVCLFVCGGLSLGWVGWSGDDGGSSILLCKTIHGCCKIRICSNVYLSDAKCWTSISRIPILFRTWKW